MRKKKSPPTYLPEPAPLKRPRPYLLISAGCFENYFWLDGPGRIIALDALSEGVISTSCEAVELLCLANMAHEDIAHRLIVAAMAEHGRTIDYKAVKTQEEMKRLTREAFEVLGDDRVREFLRETEAIVRQNLGVPKTDAEWLPWYLTAPVH